MNFKFLIQARLGSTRLPGKILKPVIGNITLLELIYQRVLYTKYADRDNVYVLTSDNVGDDVLINFLEQRGIKYFRGNEQNVYERFNSFLSEQNPLPEYFFRICADNPFLEISFIDKMCEVAIDEYPADYISYVAPDGMAIIQKKYGLFCELINTNTFLGLAPVENKYDQENVTPLLYQSGKFVTKYVAVPEEIIKKDFCLCIDTPEDLVTCRKILEKIGKTNFSYTDLLKVL